MTTVSPGKSGHLFSPNAQGATVSATATAAGPAFVIGRLTVNLLDSTAIDAARSSTKARGELRTGRPRRPTR